MKGCVRWALVAALVCSTAAVARAESNDEAEITAMAKEHYKLGLDAYNQGHYSEAIKELKKAYLLKRLPALLLNIGATYRKMNDLDNAIYYYKKYLAEAPEAKDRGDVEKTIAELQNGKAAGAPASSPPAEAPAQAEASAPPASTEWKHTPPDAAPPDQPLDLRVTMPVTKGVKVYCYYRTAGEADYQSVIMKRHGSDKVGRIPASAVTGKSLQYYIEGKDASGNVVKTFGTAADPNVVMLDASAAPQVVAGAGEDKASSGDAAAERQDLDDEAAPIMGQVEERPHHHGERSKSESGTRRFGTAFWVGSVMAVAGIAGVAVGAYGLYQAKSYADVLTADSQYRDPMTGLPYHFTDPTASPYDDKTVEQRGKFYNTLGIAMTVTGGVLAVGGATLMALDQTMFKNKREQPKRSSSAWIAPSVGPTMAGIAGGASF